MTAPIVLFVYARPDHTRRTVEALLANPEAAESDLIVFSDAAKTSEKYLSVEEVRHYIETVEGFRSITVYHRTYNYGLAKSIIEGVTQVLHNYDTVIVLEDDMVTSPYFLDYMNEGLKRFAGDDRVISIHGYVYPVASSLPETFFLRGADCWGWATWQRGWALFNSDGQFLLSELKRQKLLKAFDFNGAYGYSNMLKGQINGTNDSWAIRWYASAFLANKLTLYPGHSLVHNIGNDSSGTHCGESSVLDVMLASQPIDLSVVSVEHSVNAAQAFEHFFRESRSPKRKLISHLFPANQYAVLSRTIKDWLPPILLRQLRKLTQGRGIYFEGPFDTWDDALSQSSGYDEQEILGRVLAATLKVKRGEAAYERDSVVFNKIQYSWPVTAALMWAAAQDAGRLSVLDFGGSLGSSYFQNRQFFDGLADVRWSVIEQPHFVEIGQQHIRDEKLHFYTNVDECMRYEHPNIVLLSSVLQYLREPNKVLADLLAINATIVIIDLTIINYELSRKNYLQRVPKSIYPASYPIISLPEKEIFDVFEKNNYSLISDFQTLEFPALTDINSCFKGYLFMKVKNEKNN